MNDPSFQEFQQAIQEVLRSAGVKKGRKIEKLISVWNACMDEKIRAHTRVVDVLRGTVVVEVDSHILLQELQSFYHDEILAKVQAESEVALVGIRFRIFKERET